MDNNGANKKKGSSWGVIIAFLLLFWPVGLYLLWKKLSSDKTAVLKKSKALTVIGGIMIAIGIIGVMGGVGTTDGSIWNSIGNLLITLLFYGGGGLALVMNGRKMKVRGEKYKKYIDVVVNQDMTLIDNIAASIQVDYEEAVNELQNMIDMGYFENAYIDRGRREIILQNYETEHDIFGSGLSESDLQTKVSTCKACGANNRVADNRNNECEYCGSPL